VVVEIRLERDEFLDLLDHIANQRCVHDFDVGDLCCRELLARLVGGSDGRTGQC